MTFDQKQRTYPILPADTHPAVVQAINTAYDHIFELRTQLQQEKPAGKSEVAKVPVVDNILGLKIQGATDPASLKDGMVITWSAAVGQFIFKAP
jgi:hypothetical protein